MGVIGGPLCDRVYNTLTLSLDPSLYLKPRKPESQSGYRWLIGFGDGREPPVARDVIDVCNTTTPLP